jgi:Flp pilus assembly protein TadG
MRAHRSPKLTRFFRSLWKSTSGNAMMLMALAIPALIGGAGLAVDFSQWYLWKHELQLATDQAAMGAAWARTDSHTQDNYQTRGTQDYYANLAITSSFASAPTITLADYSNGNANSVVVTATATKALPFSSFITGRSATIQATSQASFAAGGTYSACLIATGSSGTTLEVGGNAHVTAHCGMAALSCSDDAINIDGSATVIADSIATCGTASVPDANQSAVTENVHGLVDEFADLDPPTNDSPHPPYQCIGNGSHAQASPIAGTYHGLVVSCTTVFGPGVYVIDGGTLDLTGNYSVTGTNVMFVLKNGATLKLGGSGNGNTLTLTPMLSSQFTAPPYNYSQALADRYQNMLVFEDRDSNPTSSHIINGNSNSLIQGTIYLPASNVQVNGTANINSSCLQLTAQTITVLGNATLETRCTTSQTNSAGSATPTVRLVA